jgi:hypothetical protein
MRPSTQVGRKMFHHVLVNLYQDETNAPSAQVKVSLGSNGSISEPAAPESASSWNGLLARATTFYRPGTGKLLMPGAQIRWEYHAHASGEEIKDHPQLSVYFYPKGETPKYRTYLLKNRLLWGSRNKVARVCLGDS